MEEKNRDDVVRSRVGKVLKGLRGERRITQEFLATRVGVAKSTLSSWEQGGAMIPPGKLEELTEYFGVTFNYMYSGEEDKVVVNDSERQEYPEDLMRIMRIWKFFSPADIVLIYGLAMDLMEVSRLEGDLNEAEKNIELHEN